MKLVGFMCIHNGIEFLEYSIRSTIKACDRFIIFEGGWGENILANGQPRSTDGTIQKLTELKLEFPWIEIYYLNKKTQLEQRSAVFDYIKEDSWLWLIDHDEVYDTHNIKSLLVALESTKYDPTIECIKINSYTFLNDFYHYVPIAWNRLFYIMPNNKYSFVAPNKVTKNNIPLKIFDCENSITYFHFSYCHSRERFLQKRRERILLHGKFKWRIDDNDTVFCDDVDILEFVGDHPDIMKSHPLYGVRNI